MKDYEVISLARLCNASATLLGKAAKPGTGNQSLRGLPFQIGGKDGKSKKIFVGLGKGKGCKNETVVIPVKKKAKSVLFAHRLIDSKLFENGPIGVPCARYVFNLSNGKKIVVPIRERFEISLVPTSWGQLPFNSVPDRADSKPDRHSGPWGAAGNRQTEVNQAWPRDYILFCWSNPHPGVVLESIEIVPEGPRFIVAGITLSHVDEYPFNREGKKEVQITVTKEPDASRAFDLEVEVDRGVSTFPYPLPGDGVVTNLKGDRIGWGEPKANQNRKSYVEIAATPSATVEVKSSGKTLGKANWGELQKKGKLQAGDRVQLEVVSRGLNWVHTKVVDDDTGKPVHCRVAFRSPEGIPYQPHGHHSHVMSDMGSWHMDNGSDVRLGQVSYAYIDGTCQGWLPRGDVYVDVARGFEYTPLRKRVRIKPGQREIEVRVKRIVDMNDHRYFSGDTHVHFLSTVGAHREGQAEGLNVVNLLQSQWGHLFTDTQEFTGRPNVTQDGNSIVYACSENRQHILGHLTLLGIKKQIMPWCSDGPSEAEMGGNIETTLSHWADQCHEQGGLVVLPHIPTPNCEPATLIATHRLDAVEFLIHSQYNHGEWYKYLNNGYRLPICGGTDKMTSDVPVGLSRTYVHIPEDEEFTYENWLKALRGGNTFQTSGPMVWFSVNGEPIGSTLKLTGNGGTLDVEARAHSIFPMHTLQIVQHGKVVASVERENGAQKMHLKARIKVENTTWLAARCGGPGYTTIPHYDGWRRGIFAHTSPIYVAVGGEYELFDLESATYMKTLIDGGLTYIDNTARHYDQGAITHHHGEHDHKEFLKRPFKEAKAKLQARFEKLGIPFD
ncbi:MAG: CehA/McbA family metallohydrolase [Planctomycetota bacterium]|nr:CehA/McbA family metallohydrolase [Planctomycetota bacterium]MDA1140384.1 CehA/McbA family metallohydrolase [Planctomycetota bacterium]